MRVLALSFAWSIGCFASHGAGDASAYDASAATDDGAASDAAIVCTTISRPTGSCDPLRGSCCSDSVCLDGTCGFPGRDCSGDYGSCVVRDDCCNARHSCRSGRCMY